jgi:8-oxo-dGTP pyrophosphatase MutT (NUDIX family)
LPLTDRERAVFSPNSTSGAEHQARAGENRRVASVFLLRDDSALLLQHRDNKPGLPLAGKWAPPGGHCEPFEQLEDCARREFAEETGYRLNKLSLLGSFLDDNVEGHPPYHLTVFWAIYDGKQELHCGEGQAIEFIERERVSEYDVPQYLVPIWDRAMAAMHESKTKKDPGNG